MFKIVCTNCGTESELKLVGGSIDTEEGVYFNIGDYIILTVGCPCGKKIESED